MGGVLASALIDLPMLYRGDSLPPSIASSAREHRGRTFAEHYTTEGLLAKSADRGCSRHLNRPLPVLVATHIGFRRDNADERYAAYHSPLISFSTVSGSAWHFVDRTSKKNFAQCELEDATHFMWKLCCTQVEVVGPGHYRLTYLASTKNVDRFRHKLVESVQKGDLGKLPAALAVQIVHGHVQQDQTTHTADIVDAVRYLDTLDDIAGVDDELLRNARKYAAKWSEWLVYPMDVIQGLDGYSGSFALNDCLDFHVFGRERDAPRALGS